MVSLAKAAQQLGIRVGSAKSLVLKGILPATGMSVGRPALRPWAISALIVHSRFDGLLEDCQAFFHPGQLVGQNAFE
jgi:hypothetical protein